jgi:hypothetical protein
VYDVDDKELSMKTENREMKTENREMTTEHEANGEVKSEDRALPPSESGNEAEFKSDDNCVEKDVTAVSKEDDGTDNPDTEKADNHDTEKADNPDTEATTNVSE